ncbi:MAG: hypothetical protein GC206_14080 [Alphaproteobacteria bacterium]|nr:hypothetical protein [Alphaproteobacteria bacterium]
MRVGLIIGLGICAAATTMAFAQERRVERMVVRHQEHVSDLGRIDADRDGWVTRAEAQAEADRMFDELDANGDGKLDGADHRAAHDDLIEHAAPDGEPVHVERREERRVVVVERRGAEPPTGAAAPPAPPHPPRPPVFIMMIGSSEEFDADGDGALSRAEFRAQQLRFFDAGDGNGDGRVRFEAPLMPEPPAPPVAPAPPAPPRR